MTEAVRRQPLATIEWEECFLERRPDPELTRFVKRRLGFVPDYVDYWAPCPWLARTAVALDFMRLPLLHLDLELTELAALVVAQDNSCRYCYAAHRAILRVLGFGAERIGRVERDLFTADLAPPVRVALDFVRRLSHATAPLDEADFEALRAAGWSGGAIRELAALAGLSVAANRIATLAALPTRDIERIATHWALGMLRPVLGVLARRRRGRPRPTPLPPSAREGPFGAVLGAFDGLPVGSVIAGIVDEAWRSDILPRRTKALIVAVLGRGLGCEASECEAHRLLAAEGFDDAALAEVVAHLASPALDPLEAVIVPFVRETIRYDPAHIQRRARAVRQAMTAPQFLELLGVVGLANMMCRMSPLVRVGA